MAVRPMAPFKPRIDPVKLLSCISSLLSPNGGIRSTTEVKRLVNLMGKYSKKLVSKCIYIQILKSTETDLLGQFMSIGGWPLAHQWLSDGIQSKNWSLVRELLELLLLCPVDVPRLQSNSAPKLVKTLSREEGNDGVRILAAKLVEQWLKIARGEITSQSSNVVNKENLVNRQNQLIVNPINVNHNGLEDCVSEENENDVTDGVNENVTDDRECEDGLVFKISVKDGMKTVHKVDTSPKKLKDGDSETIGDDKPSTSKSSSKDRDRSKDKDRHHKKSSSSSSSSHKSSSSTNKSSSSSKTSSSSSPSKGHKSTSSSHKSSSSSSSSRDKDRDRHRSKSSSSSSKDKKDEKTKSEASKSQAEKDKDTLAKIQPQPLAKVKIPKKTSDNAEKTSENGTLAVKKKSISIEVRKDTENRPKTAKTHNTQFRNHGLAEEAPQPPSRRDLKKPSSVPSTGLPIAANSAKRSLSPTNIIKEADKKIKLQAVTSPIVEKPGAIKLIPAKPKPSVLIESDMFMDAMTAATPKKEPRKRKRLPSGKDGESNGETQKDSKTVSAAPLRFYKDTLEESENKDDTSKLNDAVEHNGDQGESKEKKPKSTDDPNTDGTAQSSADSPEEPEERPKREPGPGCGPDGPPGVLTIHRRKGPKKSLRWKPQDSLEEVRYFELDENERINVTKTFVDMKQMERTSEREAFLISRKIDSEDTMMDQMEWQPLFIVDDVPDLVTGSNSVEREIQAEREKSTLQAIYFSRSMIPDSPHEPDVIAFQNVEPQIIPLEDITGNPDAVHDLTNMPWPEPKGSPPSQSGNNFDDLTGLTTFSSFNQFGNNMPNWSNPNTMIGLRPPTQIGFGNILAPDTVNLNMNPLQQFNAANMANLTPIMQQQLAANNMSYLGNFTQAPPPIINNDSNNRGPVNNWFGANKNNSGNNNWQQQGNNNNNQRQNWVKNRRLCTAFQRGNCRHGNKCKYLHPGVNGPKF